MTALRIWGERSIIDLVSCGTLQM